MEAYLGFQELCLRHVRIGLETAWLQALPATPADSASSARMMLTPCA